MKPTFDAEATIAELAKRYGVPDEELLGIRKTFTTPRQGPRVMTVR